MLSHATKRRLDTLRTLRDRLRQIDEGKITDDAKSGKSSATAASQPAGPQGPQPQQPVGAKRKEGSSSTPQGPTAASQVPSPKHVRDDSLGDADAGDGGVGKALSNAAPPCSTDQADKSGATEVHGRDADPATGISDAGKTRGPSNPGGGTSSSPIVVADDGASDVPDRAADDKAVSDLPEAKKRKRSAGQKLELAYDYLSQVCALPEQISAGRTLKQLPRVSRKEALDATTLKDRAAAITAILQPVLSSAEEATQASVLAPTEFVPKVDKVAKEMEGARTAMEAMGKGIPDKAVLIYKQPKAVGPHQHSKRLASTMRYTAATALAVLGVNLCPETSKTRKRPPQAPKKSPSN